MLDKMRKLLTCLFISIVSSVFCNPISQPVYPNTQYVGAQAVPTFTQKHPPATGYIQPQYIQPQYTQQYIRPQQPTVHPVYEPKAREGLQNYATQTHNQPIQQVLLTSNVDRQQVQKAAQGGGSLYLNQIQSAQIAAQAQEAFAAAQRKATSQTLNKQIQPIPIPQQPPQQTYQQTAHQYFRQQPQTRYITRPVVPQYKVQQQQEEQQQNLQEQQEREDYDHNPSYQFGFDVKDDLYTNYQNRKEQREGNKITGSYSVVDSDGFIRTVSYTADPKEGFKAEVTRQPTDIVVKIPKPDPQFQNIPRQQYIQEVAVQRVPQQEQKQQSNIIYQYQ